MSKIAQLGEMNPWWTDASNIERDSYVITWKNSILKYIPTMITKFNIESDHIYTLRGIRQVGKTTLIKILIRDLLIEKGIDPRNILYYSMETISDKKELQELLSEYIKWTEAKSSKRRFLFLDEVTIVPEWQLSIKHLYEANALRNTTTIACSSHTMDLARGAERLPGRRGLIDPLPDKVLYPMKFIEYVKIKDSEIRKWITKNEFNKLKIRSEIIVALAQGKIHHLLTELILYSKSLYQLFFDYMIHGGVIFAIETYLKSSQIPIPLYFTLKEILVGDFLKRGKSEQYLEEMLLRLFQVQSNPVSYNKLHKGTNLGSRNTGIDYVHQLQHSYVLSIINRLAYPKALAHNVKNKKFFFRDPYVFHSLRSWVYGIENPYEETWEFLKDEEKTSLLVEAIVCEHLLHRLDEEKKSPLIESQKQLFYWRDAEGNEVDFVFNTATQSKPRFLPIEVKYKNKISKKDLNGLFNFLKAPQTLHGIVLGKKKDFAEHTKYIIVPTPIFLLLC